MDIRPAIFYLSLLVIFWGVAELYVRIRGVGEKTEKVRGIVVPRRTRLGAPIVLVVAAVIAAIVTNSR